ncbi:DUF1656 domain-containing protein [Halotalea alkalilenta]|uniref:DUF1656 domain-containing protein n=1 Tax=Halotalea alkalilenta TaxID=376489 RepID=UPI000485F956|nr:DUF1656 domain-containing protein [Halotalea alkalilenta]
MYLRELSWGGVFFSPMLFYAFVSLVLAAVIRALVHKSPFGRLIWQEAWFDVALFVCLLAGVTYVAGAYQW